MFFIAYFGLFLQSWHLFSDLYFLLHRKDAHSNIMTKYIEEWWPVMLPSYWFIRTISWSQGQLNAFFSTDMILVIKETKTAVAMMLCKLFNS